jgi:hypothetical protein
MMDDYVVRAHCSYNLEDALEELQAINELVRPNVIIDAEDFKVRMAHLYWHLNTAWNCRNLTSTALEVADDDEMGKFPNDLDPI